LQIAKLADISLSKCIVETISSSCSIYNRKYLIIVYQTAFDFVVVACVLPRKWYHLICIIYCISIIFLHLIESIHVVETTHAGDIWLQNWLVSLVHSARHVVVSPYWCIQFPIFRILYYILVLLLVLMHVSWI